jgi:hypothetical protein
MGGGGLITAFLYDCETAGLSSVPYESLSTSSFPGLNKLTRKASLIGIGKSAMMQGLFARAQSPSQAEDRRNSGVKLWRWKGKGASFMEDLRHRTANSSVYRGSIE